jgi:hypothetical protein
MWCFIYKFIEDVYGISSFFIFGFKVALCHFKDGFPLHFPLSFLLSFLLSSQEVYIVLWKKEKQMINSKG